MLTARVRDQIRVTSRLLRLPNISERLQATSRPLTLGFAASFAVYLFVKLVGIVIELSPLFDLAVLPAGVCALGLAFSTPARSRTEEAEAAAQTALPVSGWLGAALLVAFTSAYLAVNTVPFITSQDESAVVNGAYQLATNGTLRVTSPLNDRYHTNIIGSLHVMYRTPTHMYYRTFPGMAVLYAPFSVMPDGIGYRLFTAISGTVAVLAVYLIARKLLGSWWAALLAALALAVSPAFGDWAVTVYNNIPALALELSAFAVALWATPDRAWPFGVAGALLSVAFFVRLTEAVYILPLFIVVLWRTRRWQPAAAFAGAVAAGIVLVGVTNLIFYQNVFFTPQVGSGYLWLPASAAKSQEIPTNTLIGTYATYTAGTAGTVATLPGLDQLRHLGFHARYLASSTFAFPFVALGILGSACWLVGRRRGWQLSAALSTSVIAILVLYGLKSGNYFGYDESIVRSSFVRYSLAAYAMLAIGIGALALEAQRIFRRAVLGNIAALGLFGVVLVVSIAQSYDAGIYGFNRLNSYREEDRAAWHDIKPVLDSQPVKPLVMGGPSAEKLIDSDYELSFINYDTVKAYRLPTILPVLQRAEAEQPVFLVLSGANPEDKQLQTLFYSQYRPQQVLHTGNFWVERLSLAPAMYSLSFVDIWNTYDALDRWTVTPDGFLQSLDHNSYVQLPAVDANGDGQVDQDMTIQFEVQDAGPSAGSISGLDSRSKEPVPLWQSHLDQTHEWLTITLKLNKGDALTNQLVVSKGLILRAIGITRVGTQ